MLPNDVAYFLNTNRIKDEQVHGQLVRHLEMVHETTGLLLKGIVSFRPFSDEAQNEMLSGAAIHDVGKVFYPDEVTGPGNKHEGEDVFVKLVQDHGFSPLVARYCSLHSSLKQTVVNGETHLTVVALADIIWNGNRDIDLELKLADLLGHPASRWETFEKLGNVIDKVALSGRKRLQYQKEGLLF